MTILVVDDDPVVCNLVAMSLEQEGFRVLTANSGTEALTRWQSRRDQIDLLITDMRMPRIDGLLLARCLAMDDPGIPVLFISGEVTRANWLNSKTLDSWLSLLGIRHS